MFTDAVTYFWEHLLEMDPSGRPNCLRAVPDNWDFWLALLCYGQDRIRSDDVREGEPHLWSVIEEEWTDREMRTEDGWLDPVSGVDGSDRCRTDERVDWKREGF